MHTFMYGFFLPKKQYPKKQRQRTINNEDVRMRD